MFQLITVVHDYCKDNTSFQYFFRDSGNETHPSESRSLKLQFLDKLSSSILTGTEIKGQDNASIRIALCDGFTGQVVNYGPEASAMVELVAIEYDFNGYEGDDWSQEEFDSKIVRETEGIKSPLIGDVYLKLVNGIGFIDNIRFRHTKCWRKRHEFRLGAKIVDGFHGVRVREAKTEPFTVGDRRGNCEYFMIHVVSFLHCLFKNDIFSSMLGTEVDYGSGGKGFLFFF